MSASNSELPSERKFGFIFFFVFVVLGIFAYFKHHNVQYSVLFGLIAAVFLLLALLAPKVLRPLNKAWFQLGLLMAKIVNPLVMAVLFFVLITPVAVLSRLFGRDVLRLKKSAQSTYWVQRDPIGPDADSFKNQF